MSRILGLSALLVILLSANVASACHAPGVRLIYNQTVDRSVQVRTGRNCVLPFGMSTGPTHSHQVAQRPSHGTITTRGGSTFVYRSHPGYVGTDQFTYVRRGLDPRGAPATFTVRVSVVVTR